MSSEFGNEPIKFGIRDHREFSGVQIRVLGLEPCPRPATDV